ncbi:MAG: ATP-binding cassette domain-containing protein [Clostridia bacterium]|nr:ATP-binding cassette domain-containing protein [Clostridia bacterium]
MIVANNVGLFYPDGTEALKTFDFHIEKGELVFITGPSGSGKTSLLKLITGMEFPTQGMFRVLGENIEPDNSDKIQRIRRMMGPVFQEFRLLEGRTVLENVMLGMRFLDLPLHVIKNNAMESIERVGLGHKLKHTVDRLSWGECQRVSIARAVARKPVLIIADEPTGNLDKENAINILDLLTSFTDTDTTVIITTHATHLIEDKQSGVFIKMNAGEMLIERRI